MLTSRCPQCGASCPVALARPTELRCRACGFTGSPDAKVVAELQAGSAALLGLDVRHRQLSSLKQRELVRARVYQGWFLGIWLAALLASFGWAAFGAMIVTDEAASPMAPMVWFGNGLLFLTPLVLNFAVGFYARTKMERRYQRLLAGAAAAPPVVAGEAARCRLCGGPVVATRELVARCGFCGADNVVAEAVVARVARKEELVAEGLARDVVARAPREEAEGLSSVTVILLFALAMPPACLVLTFALYMWASMVTVPPDLDRPYAIVERNGGRCVGRVESEKDGFRLSMGGTPPAGFERIEHVATGGATRIRLGPLKGQRVVQDGHTSVVTGFEHTLLGDDVLVLEDGYKPNAPGACFAP